MTIKDVLEATPGSEERSKALKSYLRSAKEKDLAALLVVGTRSGTYNEAGTRLSKEETALIYAKIHNKDVKLVDQWRDLVNYFIEIRAKIYLEHENFYKILNFMQAMAGLWDTYEREVTIFNKMLLQISLLEGEGARQALAIVRSFGAIDLNEGVTTWGKTPLCIFGYNKEGGLNGEGEITLSHKAAREALEKGAEVLKQSITRLKGFECIIFEAIERAKEHGEEIPDILYQKSLEMIDDCKGDLANDPNFSFKKYKELVAEGKTTEAEFMKNERFVFPDFSEVEPYQKLVDFFRPYFDIWATWT